MSRKLCFHSLMKLLQIVYICFFVQPPSIRDGHNSLWDPPRGFYPPNWERDLSSRMNVPLRTVSQIALIWGCILIYQEEVVRQVKFRMRENRAGRISSVVPLPKYAAVNSQRKSVPMGVVFIFLMVVFALSDGVEGPASFCILGKLLLHVRMNLGCYRETEESVS